MPAQPRQGGVPERGVKGQRKAGTARVLRRSSSWCKRYYCQMILVVVVVIVVDDDVDEDDDDDDDDHKGDSCIILNSKVLLLICMYILYMYTYCLYYDVMFLLLAPLFFPA